MGTVFRNEAFRIALPAAAAISALIGLIFIGQLASATTPNGALALAFVGMFFVIGPMAIFFVHALLVNHRRRDFQALFGISAPQEDEELTLLWPHVNGVLSNLRSTLQEASAHIAGDGIPPHESVRRMAEYRGCAARVAEGERLARGVGFTQQLDTQERVGHAPRAA
jgi:hypothetical protein